MFLFFVKGTTPLKTYFLQQVEQINDIKKRHLFVWKCSIDFTSVRKWVSRVTVFFPLGWHTPGCFFAVRLRHTRVLKVVTCSGVYIHLSIQVITYTRQQTSCLHLIYNQWNSLKQNAYFKAFNLTRFLSDKSCSVKASSLKQNFILSGFHCIWRKGTQANTLNKTGHSNDPGQLATPNFFSIRANQKQKVHKQNNLSW